MPVCASCGHETAEDANFCPKCGAPYQVASPPREQRKTVTVVFCDLTGSTALGESTDPEALRALLARYFERMKAIVEAHGGAVEKFIGDAVMAVFGVPVAHEDDALRACRAAVEMRHAFPELGISGRIGVNTGEVVTGTEERLATGDAVNVAARLEQAAQPGEVLIGEETLMLVREAVELGEERRLELKGKVEPVAAHSLLAVTGGLERHFATPMVGRERELQGLRDAFARAGADRSCQLFTILGSAGVGKSRLVAEFLGATEARVVRGRCLSYGEGITYWPVVEILKQLDTLPAGDAERPLRSLLGETEEPASAEEIAWGFRKLLEQEARAGQLVVVFDDLHWGEETLLDLVDHVADLSRDAPILLLCMGRPELLERRPLWGGGKWNATTVLLEPLDATETEALLAELGGVSDELRERIIQVAEGNPLFLEEMLTLVRESGGEVEVPPTIQALLAARLDQLDPAERSVLECGSVEGRTFHRGAVAALGDRDGSLDQRLVALVRKELVRPDQAQLPGDDAYRFRHLLIRDAAYDSLPKAMRADLHERFAAWLEEHGASLVELDEIVCYHLEQASRYRAELGVADLDLAARAAGRLFAVGRRALDRGDMPAAVNLLERATGLFGEEDPGRLRYLPALGRALIQSGDWERAEVVLRTAVEAGGEHDARAVVAEATPELCFIRIHNDAQAGYDDVQRELDDAIRFFEGVDDDAGLARALGLAGMLLFWSGECETAVGQLERSAAYARRAGDRWQELETMRGRMTAWTEGSTPVPVALARIAELAADAPGEAAFNFIALRSRARMEAMRGRLEVARDLAAQARQLGEQLGLAVPLAAGLARAAGEIELLAGEPAAAEQALRSGADTLERIGDWGHYASLVPHLADALLLQGRGDEAASLVEKALAHSTEEDMDAQIGLHRVAAKVAAQRSELEEAERLAVQAVALAERTDYLPLQGDAYRDLGEVLEAAGKKQQAHDAFAQALATYERKGNVVNAHRTRQTLERLAESVPARDSSR